MNNTKMLQPIKKEYKITLLTGLHIGSGDGGLKIGGIDTEVIKNPITGEPYIPGSSIKGKMRAMLEMITGDYKEKRDEEGNIKELLPSEDIKNPSNIVKAFGMATKDTKITSRLLFSDFSLTEEYKDKLKELGPDFFEDKSENSVPRFLSGNANPRHIERVPAGVTFKGIITLTPIEGENGINEKDLNDVLEEGIKYLEQFGLGGGVSRGNGRIQFEEIK